MASEVLFTIIIMAMMLVLETLVLICVLVGNIRLPVKLNDAIKKEIAEVLARALDMSGTENTTT